VKYADGTVRTGQLTAEQRDEVARLVANLETGEGPRWDDTMLGHVTIGGKSYPSNEPSAGALLRLLESVPPPPPAAEGGHDAAAPAAKPPTSEGMAPLLGRIR
jgi:hypothetical protein